MFRLAWTFSHLQSACAEYLKVLFVIWFAGAFLAWGAPAIASDPSALQTASWADELVITGSENIRSQYERCYPLTNEMSFGSRLKGILVSDNSAFEIETQISCDPDPASQGYWHRQCLGVPAGEGGIDPGGKGRGPSAPTEPLFVEELMWCADDRLEDLGLYGTLTCDGMDADPANDPCEKAEKQLTALVLNVCSGRLQETCDVDVSAQGCLSTDLGGLMAEVAGYVQAGSCRQARRCAAAVNGGGGIDNPADTAWLATVVSGNGLSGGDPSNIVMNAPGRVAIDAFGNIYVADRDNYRVLRISQTGLVATVAGTGSRCTVDPCGDGGPAVDAQLGAVEGIAIDPVFGHIYLSDMPRHRIRRIDISSGLIETVVNTDGAPCTALPACTTESNAGVADLNNPKGLAMDNQGRLYIADSSSHTVRRVLPGTSGYVDATSTIEVIAGDTTTCIGGACGDGGPALLAQMTPADVAVYIEPPNEYVYVTDLTSLVERVREFIVGDDINAFAGCMNDCSHFIDFHVTCDVAVNVQLQQPTGVAIDESGNVYIAEQSASLVTRVMRGSGELCMVAGSGAVVSDNGPACNAALLTSIDLVVEPGTNDLYIGDAANQRIRHVGSDMNTIYSCENPASDSNIITTFAGSGESFYFDNMPAITTPVRRPHGIAVDAIGNIFFGDAGGDLWSVRRIDATTGFTTTVAGSGKVGSAGDGGADALTATLGNPYSVAIDGLGNIYFVDGNFNDVVRKVDTSGKIWTVAGIMGDSTGTCGAANGTVTATSIPLSNPRFITVDTAGNLYISDAGTNSIMRVKNQGGEVFGNSVITTIAGCGAAQLPPWNPAGYDIEDIAFDNPSGIAMKLSDNSLYFADRGTGERSIFELPNAHLADINVIDTYKVHAIAGSGSSCGTGQPAGPICGDGGPALSASLGWIRGIAYDQNSDEIYITDPTTERVRRIYWNANDWYIDQFAGNSQQNDSNNWHGDGGLAIHAGLRDPTAIAVSGNNVYITDEKSTGAGNGHVRRVDLTTGIIYSIAGSVVPLGDRELALSKLNGPTAIARQSSTAWFIADERSRRVRAIDPTPGTGSVWTVAGYSNGFLDSDPLPPGDKPALYSRKLPGASGVVWDGSRYIYVSEADNHVVRRIDTHPSAWTIVTWAGTEGVPGVPSTPGLNRPAGLAIDTVRGLLYVADNGNQAVVSIDLGNPTNIQFVAGSTTGVSGCPITSGDASGPATTYMRDPVALALDEPTNSLYIADSGCHMVRRIDLGAVPPQSYRVIGDGQRAGTGQDVIAGSNRLSDPRGLAVDDFGNLYITSGNLVVNVAVGSNNSYADETDNSLAIYGAGTTEFESFTGCLTGIGIVNPGDGIQDELYVVDRCVGYMLRLQRTTP